MSKDIQSEQSFRMYSSTCLVRTLKGTLNMYFLSEVHMCYQYWLTYVASVCGLGTE